MRFIVAKRPRWIAMEEVKQVLPVWEVYASILRRLGYSCWAGRLNAANFGLPQARKRAFFLASLDGQVHPPQPTHAEQADEGLFDSRLPWVTMAQALDWSAEDCIAANKRAGEKAYDPTLAMWPLSRPATTVVRSFRPDVIAAPGYRTLGSASRQNAPGSVAVTPEEMCILQGIRTDYPFTAPSAGKKLSLIGAVLPPTWAAQILRPLISLSMPLEVVA
jgi:DNA (cytosine-5)-methyltransferase 1